MSVLEYIIGLLAPHDCLARSCWPQQVGATCQQHLQQLERAFRITKPLSVRGAHIVLVDDVITTDATLGVAAQALRQAGASSASTPWLLPSRLDNEPSAAPPQRLIQSSYGFCWLINFLDYATINS